MWTAASGQRRRLRVRVGKRTSASGLGRADGERSWRGRRANDGASMQASSGGYLFYSNVVIFDLLKKWRTINKKSNPPRP